MAVNTDPREIIARSPMSALQIIAVAITIGLNALDGFDVMSITFASPGIATEWGIDRAALGIVLSMELIGMALGSILLGGVADKIGRRRTVLGCLLVMLLGMFMVTTTSSLVVLSFWRVLTGLGIGGMLASINAIAAEFSSNKRRHLSVSIMSIGYPVGVVLGGLVVQQLLQDRPPEAWRSIFYFGGIVTATFVPLVFFFVPESVHWLTRKQPAGALEKINNALARMKHPTASALPVISDEVRRRSIGEAFAPAMIATTILCAVAYFFHITTFYFIMKWVPKIVADFGFPAASAAGVLVWGNVGGAIGGTVLGLLTLRFGVKGLTIAVLLLSTVAVIIFGRTPHDLGNLSLIVGACGFFTNAGIVGLYAIFAHAFPTHIRAFGTGFAIGFGRGGAVIAPIAAGFLFTAGIGLPTVALILAFGSLIGAVVLSFIKLKPEPAEAEDTVDRREAIEGSPLTT
jgi:benzoate transport